VSNAASTAIPVITGVAGLVIGAGFSRVTSRNDKRREQYAEALSALERQSPVTEAQRSVDEIANWLELDSVPVSNAFKHLCEAYSSPAPDREAQVKQARARFVDVAHKYSSWKLPQRLWLQAVTKRSTD